MEDFEGEITPLNNVIGLDGKTVERFISKVDRSGGPDACWPWLDTLNDQGYGQFSLNYSPRPAHRVCWMLCIGEIPPRRQLHHVCENTSCVNPKHLKILTPQEHNRHHKAGRTHCRRGHEYTEESSYVYNGTRQCRKCIAFRHNKKRYESGVPVPPPSSQLYCKNNHPLFGDNMSLFAIGDTGKFGRRCKTCALANTQKYNTENREKYLGNKRDLRALENNNLLSERGRRIKGLDMQDLTNLEVWEAVRLIIAETAIH